MLVLKFGGSSVADATRMSGVLDIVENLCASDRLVLVSSAISGCTDALLSHNREEFFEMQARHRRIIRRLFTSVERDEALAECDSLFEEINAMPDTVEAYGEILSTRILERKLATENVATMWLDSRKLVVKGDEPLTYKNIREAVETHPEVKVFVAPGFIASDSQGRVTTLGRGGSDYSAALYAAALQAERLEIWTDVPGVMTTNPKDVSRAKTITEMSYEAAFCMAEHGAKVLYPPTVEPVKRSAIPMHIKSTFDPKNPGTVISSSRSESKWVGATRIGDEICIVSEGAIDRNEASDKLSFALGRSSVDILSENYGEDFVCVKVQEGMGKAALKALHKEFFELEEKNLRLLYIAGKGAVGTALADMIHKSGENIRRSSGKTLRIMAQADSSNPHFCEDILKEAPAGAVFVDCTDSETIYKWYVPLLEAGVNVVTSNRRSMSVPYAEYAAMKNAAIRGGCFLRYETTVGAALPALESVAMSANSSDEIIEIEAVVSCTLNYILSSDLPRQEALHKAQEIGLTERDPRQDFEGRDALRKLLILAREAGVRLEAEDVEIEPVTDISKVGQNQRFVALLRKDGSIPHGYSASISLRPVDEKHPAYWIKGTENVFVIRSAFNPSPLIIRGRGEGAKQAASRLLNDILK